MASHLAPKPAGAPRVIWVIFDEWDEELTFPDRPSRIQLPEIDRLRATDFSATEAIRPNMFTDWSMPALTTGIALEDIHPRGPAELMIRPRGCGHLHPLERAGYGLPRGQKNGLQHRGGGLGHPLLPGSEERPLGLLVVERQQSVQQRRQHVAGDAPQPAAQPLRKHLPLAVWPVPFHHAPYLGYRKRGGQVPRSRARLRLSGLALLHMPVPHPPYFYNAVTGKNDRGATPITGIFQQTQEGYVDALALTDKIIGQLRRSMEQAGVWDTTTVIFSADHPFRHRSTLDGHPVSRRVPYLVKMAGPQEAVALRHAVQRAAHQETDPGDSLRRTFAPRGDSAPGSTGTARITGWTDLRCGRQGVCKDS